MRKVQKMSKNQIREIVSKISNLNYLSNFLIQFVDCLQDKCQSEKDFEFADVVLKLIEEDLDVVRKILKKEEM